MTDKAEQIKYSIIVCSNNHELFGQFVETMKRTSILNYEIICIENKDGQYSLPEALNIGISRAKGNLFFFCHQDIRFPASWLETALLQIDILQQRDKAWGVIGIMGVTKHGFFAGNIMDPHTQVQMGNLPCEVASLDEVCLIIRKDSNLHFDESLGSFHLYGADICLQAQHNNLKCYAINAPFEHLSGGKLDSNFWKTANRLKEKWSRIQATPLTIETTCGVFQLKQGLTAFLMCSYKLLRQKIISRIQGRHKAPQKTN